MLKQIIKACFATIRPLLGPPGACRYELPCTDYALMQLKDLPFLKAVCSITIRVLSCNPLTYALRSLFNKLPKA